MSDIQIATVFFTTAATGNKEESHGHFCEHPELGEDLRAGWRVTDMRSSGAAYQGFDVMDWLTLTMIRADSTEAPRQQKLVSIFLTPKGFGRSHRRHAMRYDTYPELNELLAQGWEPVSSLDVGFPRTTNATGNGAGWLVFVLERF